MADGPLISAEACAGLPLLQGVGRERRLVARCPACARTAACDPSFWVAEGLGGAALRTFSERLRCVCGGRQARLEIWAGVHEPADHPDIVVFR